MAYCETCELEHPLEVGEFVKEFHDILDFIPVELLVKDNSFVTIIIPPGSNMDVLLQVPNDDRMWPLRINKHPATLSVPQWQRFYVHSV